MNRDLDDIRPGVFGGNILVRREPLGVVAAIVPWNFPQTLAAFKYAPALAAGCTLVIKPSPETVLDSYVFAEAVAEAGLPPGVINVVPAGRDVGAYLVAHPGVDKISFTGSTAAGRAIGEVCGKLLKPVTLELGGKSAAIVLDDADLDLQTVGQELFTATLLNNGQTCFLGTRVLAPRTRYDEIVDLFTAFAESLTVGNARDDATQIGPLATAGQRDRVERYIAKGRGDGARITYGGGRPAGMDKGWFVEPTVFADVDNHHTIAQQEIFGPVLSIIPYSDDQEAVRIANDSDYGLGGTVWTSDPDRGLAVAKQIQTGTIGVNTYLPDPAAPFGGVKASGLGRELGPEGLANLPAAPIHLPRVKSTCASRRKNPQFLTKRGFSRLFAQQVSPIPLRGTMPFVVAAMKELRGARPRPIVVQQFTREGGVEERKTPPRLNQPHLGSKCLQRGGRANLAEGGQKFVIALLDVVE